MSLDHHLGIIDLHLYPAMAACFSCQVQPPAAAAGAVLCQAKKSLPPGSCTSTAVRSPARSPPNRQKALASVGLKAARRQGDWLETPGESWAFSEHKSLPAEDVRHPPWSQPEETSVCLGQESKLGQRLGKQLCSLIFQQCTCGQCCLLLLQIRAWPASCSSTPQTGWPSPSSPLHTHFLKPLLMLSLLIATTSHPCSACSQTLPGAPPPHCLLNAIFLLQSQDRRGATFIWWCKLPLLWIV